jgi:hypothetical protein
VIVEMYVRVPKYKTLLVSITFVSLELVEIYVTGNSVDFTV